MINTILEQTAFFFLSSHHGIIKPVTIYIMGDLCKNFYKLQLFWYQVF